MRTTIQTKNGNKVIDLNRRKAIRERCMNCSAWHPSEVAECKIADCYLFPFRSGAGKQDSKKRNKAIRKYCLWCCDQQPAEARKCPTINCPLWAFRKSTIDRTFELKYFIKNPRIDLSSGMNLTEAIQGYGLQISI